jgi:23S rRNA pseudouridine2605 synthase
MISSGRVQVDGQLVTALGTKIDPEQASILVDGRPVSVRPPALYVALHKPAGFVTTRADPHAAHTVMELVLPSLEARLGRGNPSVEGLHPVGRLDRESEGLLLLTNDGAFTHALTHPRHQVAKRYLAEVAGRPTAAELEQLRAGVIIDGRRTAPAEARLVSGPAARDGARIELVLREGRKRQVRLMLAAVGHPVRSLLRTAIGPVSLGSLKLGQFRLLSPGEVLSLLEAASGSHGPADLSSDSQQTAKSSGRHTRAPGQPTNPAKQADGGAAARSPRPVPPAKRTTQAPPRRRMPRQ